MVTPTARKVPQTLEVTGAGHLTLHEQAFVHHYLCCWNIGAAANRCGVTWKQAKKMSEDSRIQAVIDAEFKKRMRKVKATAQEVLEELSSIAMLDVSSFYEEREIEHIHPVSGEKKTEIALVPKPLEDLTPTQRAALKSPEGKYGPQFHDKMAALTILARHYGLLVDRQEVTGPDGQPIQHATSLQIGFVGANGESAQAPLLTGYNDVTPRQEPDQEPQETVENTPPAQPLITAKKSQETAKNTWPIDALDEDDWG